MCDSTNRCGNKCGDKVSAGVEAEAGAEVGLDLGRAEGLSAICRHGRDPGECLASEGDSAGGPDGWATLTSAPASHGFRGGGGLTQMSTDPPATDTPTRRIRSTLTQDTGKQMKGG